MSTERTSMKEIIYEDLRPKMVSLFWRVAEGGKDFVMDGVPVYNEKAQFVGGKAINMSCYVVLELLKGTEDYEKGLKTLGDVIRMVSDLPMATWGILNGITGLYRLKMAGLLEQVVDEETLESLKKSLDWRTFVDVDDHYALISKPTNYYGVAFGIASYRELMGWEAEGHSRILLNRLMEHITQYSGELNYMDETPGAGRFDRYSILIPSEVSSLTLAAGMEVPDLIRTMLNNSTHVFLKLSNKEGMGFPYGRSIGAYGDTAALEVLSAAAEVGGIYTEEEMELAYGYSVKLMENMVNFWYDEEMQSINMWEKGRRTDGYRNKNRILGENMSLFMQMVNSYEHWIAAGWGERQMTGDLDSLMEQVEKRSLTYFAKGDYDRALAIVRDKGHVWTLPVIGGGSKYYQMDAYFPIPHGNRILDDAPDCSHGSLVPEFTMADGRILRPVSYIKSVEAEEQGDAFVVTCRQEQMCLMGGEGPEAADGISAVTVYEFREGSITRRDEFTIAPETEIAQISLTALLHSQDGTVSGQKVSFAQGVIQTVEAEGYEACIVKTLAPEQDYCTPRGALQTAVVWTRKNDLAGEKICLNWKMTY